MQQKKPAAWTSRLRLLLSLIASIILINYTLYGDAAPTTPITPTPQTPEPPTRHALFIGIPLPGHLNPLVSQGLELQRRGWRVTIASPNRMKSHILGSIRTIPHMTYMDLGDCAAIAELTETLERAADHENYLESTREMFHWALQLHHCMFVSLHKQISALTHKPNIIISDLATFAGFDVADELRIPFIVNNPDLLNLLSPEDISPYDFIPGTMTAKSITTMNSSATAYGLLERTIYPPLRQIICAIAELTTGKELAEQQQAAGVRVTGIFQRHNSRLILTNGAFGLEWSRPLPPNVVMVGPMLDRKWENSVALARATYQQQLSTEDLTWLSWKAPGSTTPLPVIWVSMGTIAPLNERQVQEMLAAFELGTSQGHFRVLWKLDQSDHGYLPAQMPPPQLLKITTWVSSQLGVLAHDATHVFLSHCGINSVHESVYLGTKLLCIPILADQADMAARVQDAGCGLHLSKSTFVASNLTDSILTLLAPENAAFYNPHLARARAAMKLAGGVERAADYIEYVSEHGTSSLVPVDQSHPWYVRSNLDVLAIYLTLIFLTYKFWHWVCCQVRPGKECVDHRKKVQQERKKQN